MTKSPLDLNASNRQAYETVARAYAGPEVGEDDPAHRQACRDGFVGLLNGKEVLEVGCGPGTDSKRFFDAGLDVLASDFCQSFLDVVKERYPEIPTLILDMTKPFDLGTFDGIYGHSCFLHIAHELALSTLQHLRQAL